MTSDKPWMPVAGESVNYYGSLRAFHGAARVLHGPYRQHVGSSSLYYSIDCYGQKLKDVRRASLHPLYTPETEPERLAETWCGYCGQTKPVNKTDGRVRVHNGAEGRCGGSGKLPRFTIEHVAQSPHQGRAWIVRDNATAGNMCDDVDAPDEASGRGWFATYADARAAVTLRELEGFGYSGEKCVNCISPVESNGYDYRHLGRDRHCPLRPGCTAEPEPRRIHAPA